MSKAKTPGDIFKEARLKKGWTQVEVGKKAGLGKNTYPKIERGVTKPDRTSIAALVKALDIEPSKVIDLLG